MVTSCAVAGYSIKRVANSKYGFFQLQSVIDSDERSEKLSRDRRKLGLARINIKNLTENQLAVKSSTLNAYSNHFISGRLSKLYETCDPDWAPSSNPGYSPHNRNTSGIQRFNRGKRRKEFQMHQQQAKIDSKMKKDVEKKQTTTSSSNLFTQSEESLQTSEELFNTTGCQKEFDIDQELVKRKEEKAKLRRENSDLK